MSRAQLEAFEAQLDAFIDGTTDTEPSPVAYGLSDEQVVHLYDARHEELEARFAELRS